MFLEVARGYNMAFSLLLIGPTIFGTMEDLIAYLQNRHLLGLVQVVALPRCYIVATTSKTSTDKNNYTRAI